MRGSEQPMCPRFAEQRRRMVDRHLKARDIRDPRLLEAMSSLERHLFVDGPMRNHAYEDRALPIGSGQTISQPYIVALMTQMLELRGGERVLEIGTGSGYQAALLSMLCARIYTVERHSELARRAKLLFDQLGIRNVVCRRGDGSIGWQDEAPFEAIIVTAAAPEVPRALARQLALKGRLVVPVGDRDHQELRLVRRLGEERFEGYSAGGCIFVPLLGREGWQE